LHRGQLNLNRNHRPVHDHSTGGRAPYTYLWSLTAGSATINSATSAITTFTKTGVSVLSTATARCVVTDSLGTTVTVSSIGLQFIHET
jgi:hypothetical protein